LIKDTVALGGARVVNQSLLLVEITEPTDMDGDEEPRVWDGVCGLGWGPDPASFVAQIYSPFYQGMRQAGMKAVFALYPPTSEGGAGYLAVGEVPLSSQLMKRVVWSPHIEAAQMWMAKAHINVIAADPSQPKLSRGDVNIVIDTGSDYIITPRATFDEFKNFLIVELSKRMGDEAVRVVCPEPMDGRPVFECECSVAPTFGNIYITFLLATQMETLQISVANLWEPSDSRLSGAKDRCTFMVRPDDLHETDNLLRSGVPQRPFGHPAMQGGSRYGRTPYPIQQHRPDEGESSIVAKEVISVSLKSHPDWLCKLELGVQKDGHLQLLEYTVYDRHGQSIDALDAKEECRKKAPPEATRRLLLREQSRRMQENPAIGAGPGPMYQQEIWRVGDIFLRRFVTILDFDGQRVGFLPADLLVKHDDDDDGFFPSSFGLVAGLLACILAPLAVMAMSKRSFNATPREIRMVGGRLSHRMQTIQEGDEAEEEDPFAAE